MTDRLKGVYVVFDHDIREDDAEAIINAIKMIKHVADVSPVGVEGSDYINRSRINMEWTNKLLSLV